MAVFICCCCLVLSNSGDLLLGKKCFSFLGHVGVKGGGVVRPGFFHTALCLGATLNRESESIFFWVSNFIHIKFI